ncbi:MAG TPA: SPFH domain-containing protein [Bacillota bacterium]|nr:SPFH domain-containing protein [Bacillota bacterium]
MIWIYIGALILIGLFIVLILCHGFVQVSQGQAAIIERFGKFNRVLRGGLHLRIPFLETFRCVGQINRPEYRKEFGSYRVDLREQIFDVAKQAVITKDNVPLEVDTIIYYLVAEPEKTVYGITDLPKAIEELAQTLIRNEFGRMELDISLGARDQIKQNIKAALDEATGQWGIRILRVEIQEIIPPNDLKKIMEEQMIAERDRRVKVSSAQAEKESVVLLAEAAKARMLLEAEAAKSQAVLKAEADKQCLILQAQAMQEQQVMLAQAKKEALTLESEGEKIAALNRAEAEAAGLVKQLNSQAEGLAQISQALNSQESNEALLTIKRLETAVQIAEKLGNGQATKIFLPQEATGLMGTILGLLEGLKLNQPEK